MSYGYYNLYLFDGKLSLPIRLYLEVQTENTLSIRQGYDGKLIKVLKVIPTDGSVDKITEINQIDKIIPWTKTKSYIYDNSGKLKDINEYPGLKHLIDQNKDKKSDRIIECLSFCNNRDISWKWFNGRQFYTISGSKDDKTVNPDTLHLYTCLLNILKETDMCLLIRFFSRSGQELGLLHEDNGYLKISGIYSHTQLKPINNNIIKVDINNNVYTILKDKLMKNINTDTLNDNLCILDWVEFYNKSIHNLGLSYTFKKNNTEINNINNSNLLDILNSL